MQICDSHEHRIVANVDLEWCKSRHEFQMTVQTAVALQNNWSVSDLVLHMEVAQIGIETSDSIVPYSITLSLHYSPQPYSIISKPIQIYLNLYN